MPRNIKQIPEVVATPPTIAGVAQIYAKSGDEQLYLLTGSGVELKIGDRMTVESPIPTPGPEWEGITLIHVHSGEKTELLTCLQNSTGGYEWIKIGEST